MSRGAGIKRWILKSAVWHCSLWEEEESLAAIKCWTHGLFSSAQCAEDITKHSSIKCMWRSIAHKLPLCIWFQIAGHLAQNGVGWALSCSAYKMREMEVLQNSQSCFWSTATIWQQKKIWGHLFFNVTQCMSRCSNSINRPINLCLHSAKSEQTLS